MLSLRDLQEQFVGVLFEDRPEWQVSWVRPGNAGMPLRDPRRVGVAARLAIYRNNLHEGFSGALALEFPVIQCLVGDDYFRQLAREFLGAHPSRAGDLHAIGGPFPAYLRGRFAETEYAYLPDVADLEWAFQQAAIAADAPALDMEALARVAPESYGSLRFAVHPACFLVQSVYPVLKIWQVNQSEAGDTDIVDLSAGPDHLVTRRVGDATELRRITPAEYVLLECLCARGTLTEGLAALEQLGGSFDLAPILRRLIFLGLICHFSH